jgi:AcrR family transcriptional regulator
VPSTRQRILDEAVALFLTSGYTSGSLRTIADRVGITQAAVYYHFPAKDDLLIELFEPPLSAYAKLVDEVEARRKAEGTVDRRALLSAVLDHLLEHRDVVSLVETDIVVQHHPRWGSRMEQLREQCARLLAGDPTDPDPARQLLAAAALAMLVGPVVNSTDWRAEARELLLNAAMRVLDTPHKSWNR